MCHLLPTFQYGEYIILVVAIKKEYSPTNENASGSADVNPYFNVILVLVLVCKYDDFFDSVI